jgi:hypothetical protein
MMRSSILKNEGKESRDLEGRDSWIFCNAYSVFTLLCRRKRYTKTKERLDMPRIAVVSMFDDNYTRMAEITVNHNFKKYCDIHGYDLIQFKIDEEFLEGRHPQWGKIKLLQNLLIKKSHDWIFFLDCDCLFMNLSIKLEDIIDERFELIIPEGGGSPDNCVSDDYRKNNLMSSQMLVKNSDLSLELLREIWEAPDWPENMDINEFDHEMRQLRISSKKDKWRGKIKWVEEKKLNRFWPSKNPYIVDSFPHLNKNIWEPGDFIVHVTTYETNERIEILGLLKDFVGGKIGKWERDGDKIWFKPLVDLNYFCLYLHVNGEKKLFWEFTSASRKSYYWVQIENYTENTVLKMEAFDILKNQISSFLF